MIKTKGEDGVFVKILNSGSDGNCCVVQDSRSNQLLLDCGLPYETIMTAADFQKINFVLVTHSHNDHSKSEKKFRKFYVPVFSYKEIHDGVTIDEPFWKIIPIKLVHNVECYGFLIYSKIEKKKLAYITDTNYIPKLGNVECLIIDVNYDKEIVEKKFAEGMPFNIGYRNHLSTQDVAEYLKLLDFRIKNLVAFHISNSSLNDIKKIETILGPLVDNLIISRPNTEIKF